MIRRIKRMLGIRPRWDVSFGVARIDHKTRTVHNYSFLLYGRDIVFDWYAKMVGSAMEDEWRSDGAYGRCMTPGGNGTPIAKPAIPDDVWEQALLTAKKYTTNPRRVDA